MQEIEKQRQNQLNLLPPLPSSQAQLHSFVPDSSTSSPEQHRWWQGELLRSVHRCHSFLLTLLCSSMGSLPPGSLSAGGTLQSVRELGLMSVRTGSGAAALGVLGRVSAGLAEPQDVVWIPFYQGFDLMLRISILSLIRIDRVKGRSFFEINTDGVSILVFLFTCVYDS